MRNRSMFITLAIAAAVVAIPASSAVAQPVGSGTGSQGCYSQEGIPIDHGQSVIVGDTTISCNNGTVCMSRKGVTFCYFAPDSANPGRISVPPTKPRYPVVIATPIKAATLLAR